MRKQNRKRIIRPISNTCGYCDNNTNPDYKEVSALKTYVTNRGKLLGRPRTGLCQKHPRQLTIAVKRARHLAKIPFVTVLG